MIFTKSSEKTALTCLSQNDWKLDVATDKFFQNPELYVPNLKGALDKKKLEQLYNRYRGRECWNVILFNISPFISDFIKSLFTPSNLDPHDDNKIGIDGIQQFCDDLTLDPASISVLLIAWKFRAATQCEFSKQEFMDGMAAQGWEFIFRWFKTNPESHASNVDFAQIFTYYFAKTACQCIWFNFKASYIIVSFLVNMVMFSQTWRKA